jgi:RNA polymerase sigma-70 factor (ECF subfamily)
MTAAQAGDRAAYAALLSDLAPLLRNVYRRRYRFLGREDAEDIVQDVLLAVHSVRATYDPARPFLPWLMAIAHNRAVDAIRRFSRRSAREVTVAEYPETLDAAEANLSGEGYGDPEVLRLAVAELPEGQRKAIEMLKFRELSLKEAANESGMSVGALKAAVHRATRTLRAVLGKRDERAD